MLERDKSDMYQFKNRVLLDAVRTSMGPGARLLDVGCASGGLLERVGASASYRVGIEPNPTAAAAAQPAADEIFNCRIDDEGLSFPPGQFDMVVCGDVLEHLVDPAAALSRIVSWTADGGTVVISVPNIANWQSRFRLLRGVWRYEDTGIWDDGHLRFFTLKSLKALIGDAGLSLESTRSTQALPFQVPAVGVLPASWGAGAERGLSVLAAKWPQLFAFQLIAVCRKPS